MPTTHTHISVVWCVYRQQFVQNLNDPKPSVARVHTHTHMNVCKFSNWHGNRLRAVKKQKKNLFTELNFFHKLYTLKPSVYTYAHGIQFIISRRSARSVLYSICGDAGNGNGDFIMHMHTCAVIFFRRKEPSRANMENLNSFARRIINIHTCMYVLWKCEILVLVRMNIFADYIYVYIRKVIVIDVCENKSRIRIFQ